MSEKRGDVLAAGSSEQKLKVRHGSTPLGERLAKGRCQRPKAFREEIQLSDDQIQKGMMKRKAQRGLQVDRMLHSKHETSPRDHQISEFLILAKISSHLGIG